MYLLLARRAINLHNFSTDRNVKCILEAVCSDVRCECFSFQSRMESMVRRKSESEGQERAGTSQTKQYTRNIQRIFNHESNFRFRQLESYDEDKELLSPTESEHDDLLGLGTLPLLEASVKAR